MGTIQVIVLYSPLTYGHLFMLWPLFVIRTRTCLNLPGQGRTTEHILIVYTRIDRNMDDNIVNG